MRQSPSHSSSKRRGAPRLPLAIARAWVVFLSMVFLSMVFLSMVFLGTGTAIGQTRGAPRDRLASEGEAPEREDEAWGDELESERDSFTPSTAVVGKGRLLAEAAYSFVDDRDGDDSHSFPELLTRVGLAERIEMRLGWNYEMGGGGSVSGSSSSSEGEAGEGEDGSQDEEGKVLYGFKFLVSRQRDWIPQSSLIVQAWTPTSGPGDTTTFMGGYVFGWKTRNDWTLDAALRFGTEEEEGDHYRKLAPSIVAKVPFLARWNAHLEYFGIITQDRAGDVDKHYVSPGVHYLVTPDLEVGVRIGAGLNDDAARFFTNAGAALRF